MIECNSQIVKKSNFSAFSNLIIPHQIFSKVLAIDTLFDAATNVNNNKLLNLCASSNLSNDRKNTASNRTIEWHGKYKKY